jgi:hypothetical protein
MRWSWWTLLLCAACSAPSSQLNVSVQAAADEARDEADLAAQRGGLFRGWGLEPYLLDPLPRHLDPDQPLVCESERLVAHKSAALRYSVRVHPAFVARLARFDAFVQELATAHYGRSARKLRHRGAFACRSTRGRKQRLSEHALGNALDFAGLDFGPLPRGAQAPDGLPFALRRPFSVRVGSHWTPRRAVDVHHARFLHRLADELRVRPDIFRGIVGPPRPRHHDHLHLDAAPWRYAMFGYEPVLLDAEAQ